MKRFSVLVFFLSVFAVLAAMWYFYPSAGVKVAGVKLRFPSYESYLFDIQDTTANVSVDSVLSAVQKSFEMDETTSDTLSYYHKYLTLNPNRISLPNDDYTFFDSLFAGLESASDSGRIVRILHYGDSQIEMDRISAIFRQRLQERFGGSGAGMVPMVQRIPSVSLSQSASGSITRYAMVGDSLTRRAQSRRYGPLTQFVEVGGDATFAFNRTKNRYAQEGVKHISRIAVLLGQNSAGFELLFHGDTLAERTAVLDSASSELSLISWKLPSEVGKGSLKFSGDAEIYGIALDGESGVAVDNVALRGCAGYIFSSIDREVMKQAFRLTDTRLIIMQFGGNAVPGISSARGVSAYVEKLVKQFDYFREVAPDAQLMFIGPSDMCKSEDGNIITYPILPQLNDSLRVKCLRNGVAYWDMFSVMGGAGSMKEWVNHQPPLGGPDYIHFTNRGANEIGEALSKSFLLYHDFYKLRKELPEASFEQYVGSKEDSLKVML